MCLLVLAWQAHPRYRLIVAANRDEFHERPTAPLAPWPAPDNLLGGKDLRAGGTWLGVDGTRRVGVVTNYREHQRPSPDAPSRGQLIPGFLRGRANPRDYLNALEPRAADFSGFNLLLADGDSLWYASNRAQPFARSLAPGVYGLSNELLDTPWPKLRRVRGRFETWLASSEPASPQGLFDLLADPVQAGEDSELPRTGLTLEWERLLSAPFVRNPEYGTRSSTVLLLEPSGSFYLAERRFDPTGASSGESRFRLGPGQWV